jgi:hypothetical protein
VSNLTNDLGSQSAYPSDQTPLNQHANGLTKRELFAAMAMQGWLAGCENAYGEFTAPGTNTHIAAESAVKYADALLSALKETP